MITAGVCVILSRASIVTPVSEVPKTSLTLVATLLAAKSSLITFFIFNFIFLG